MIYFNDKETSCRCGCGQNILNDELCRKIDLVRADGGFPLHINSWNRCKVHNADVGGVKNSSHTLGEAIDVQYKSGQLFSIIGSMVKFGFKRILIYPNSKFIHIDVSQDKSQNILIIMEQ